MHKLCNSWKSFSSAINRVHPLPLPTTAQRASSPVSSSDHLHATHLLLEWSLTLLCRSFRRSRHQHWSGILFDKYQYCRCMHACMRSYDRFTKMRAAVTCDQLPIILLNVIIWRTNLTLSGKGSPTLVLITANRRRRDAILSCWHMLADKCRLVSPHDEWTCSSKNRCVYVSNMHRLISDVKIFSRPCITVRRPMLLNACVSLGARSCE